MIELLGFLLPVEAGGCVPGSVVVGIARVAYVLYAFVVEVVSLPVLFLPQAVSTRQPETVRIIIRTQRDFFTLATSVTAIDVSSEF